jgi:predicted nucleic acid-binding protein
MERRRSVANEFFLDASFAIALASRRDQYHARAVELSEHLQ